MNFNETLTKKVENIEKIISKFLPEEKGYQKTVLEAMNYSVLAGGKRLRPMLVQEVFEAFGGTTDVAEPFMARCIANFANCGRNTLCHVAF